MKGRSGPDGGGGSAVAGQAGPLKKAGNSNIMLLVSQLPSMSLGVWRPRGQGRALGALSLLGTLTFSLETHVESFPSLRALSRI